MRNTETLSKSIQISICTRRRPLMLRKCLKSFQQLIIPADTDVCILVVENDDNPAAQELAEELALDLPLPVHYCSEPRPGIPIARNRALRIAMEHNIDYLAFIDDDEWIDPNWLAELYAYLQSKDKDIVIHGHVISCISEQTHLSPFLQRNALPTGTRLNCCATNNVIFPVAAIAERGLEFDETRPLSGGSDILFFSAAHTAGMEIHECSEAIVYEDIPASRATVRWLTRRWYRMGTVQVERKTRMGRARAMIFLSVAARIPFLAVTGLLSFCTFNRRHAIRQWLKLAKAAGCLAAVCGGGRVDSYRTVDGN